MHKHFAIVIATVMVIAVAWPSLSSATEPNSKRELGGAPLGASGSLRVLSLNTALLTVPIIGGDQPCVDSRAAQLGRFLREGIGAADYDVVMLQEVFDGSAANRLLEELAGKYPYRVYQEPLGSLSNGGLAVFSKYPFLPVWYLPVSNLPSPFYAFPWQECDSWDCASAKGWLHVRINFLDIPVNVFSLHTQANYEGGGGNYTRTQQQQIAQLKDYIDGFPYWNFAADLSRELMVLGGDYNVLAHCLGCKMASDYMSVTGILGMREVWREAHCYLDSVGDYSWRLNAEGLNGESNPSGARLDMILYDDSRSVDYEIRPRDVSINTFYIGFPSGICEDDGDPSFDYPWGYVSDHWGVEATLDVYPAAAAPPENTQCGLIPTEPATGNPFQYSRLRDQYLACYGIAGGNYTNCNDIWDINDKQLCTAMSIGQSYPCDFMNIRDLRDMCDVMLGSTYQTCLYISDEPMQSFCLAVALEEGSFCAGIADRDAELLCYAMVNGISSNCRDISNLYDRQFCYAVSSRSNSYCASIPAGEPDPPPPPPPIPPPPNCTNFDYSQCIPFQTCQSFCLIGDFSPIGHPCCGCTCNGFDECPLCLDPGFE